MNHNYNTRNVCVECGCSKTYIDANGTTCVPVKPEIQIIKPKLQYGEIAAMVGVLEDCCGDVSEMRKRLNVIKDKSSNPAIIDWIIEEYKANMKKWKDIEGQIEMNPMDDKLSEKVYKPKLSLKIECNTLKAEYKLLEVIK
jgi:hypothetical protein